MAQLSEELTTTENRIAFARQTYNDAVTGYNTARETFPSTLVAESFGFGAAALFEIEEDAAAEAPRIAFDRP
jgi:LemA protein